MAKQLARAALIPILNEAEASREKFSPDEYQKAITKVVNYSPGGSAQDEDPNRFTEPVDEFALARVLVLYRQKIWEYLNYRNRRKYDCEGVELGERKREELEEVALYSSLVGRECAHSMLLYRSSSS